MLKMGISFELMVFSLIVIGVSLFFIFEFAKKKISEKILVLFIIKILFSFFIFSLSYSFLIERTNLGRPVPFEKLIENKEMELIFYEKGFSLVAIREDNFVDVRLVVGLPPMKRGQRFLIRNKMVIFRNEIKSMPQLNI